MLLTAARGRLASLLSCSAVALLASACISSRDLQALKEFDAELGAAFHMSLPGVEYRNNTDLILSLEDVQFSTMDSNQRENAARGIARYSVEHFPLRGDLRAITVVYVRVDSSSSRTIRLPYQVFTILTKDLRPDIPQTP